MLSLGKLFLAKAATYVFPNKRAEDIKRLEELLSRFKREDGNDEDALEPKREKPPPVADGTFFKRKGTITKFSENFGEIDYGVTFGAEVIEECTFGDSLAVNMQVIYKAIKMKNGSLKAVKIESIFGESWGDEDYDQKVSAQTYEEEITAANFRSVHACIIDKNGSLCSFESDNEKHVFNLDDVELMFIPEPGDYCMLECYVEYDKNIFDGAGNTLKIEKCTYSRLIEEQGRVTELCEGYGRIDMDIMFNLDFVEGPPVKVGDIVNYSAIECNFRGFSQRCLKLSVAHQVSDIKKYDPQLFKNKNGMVLTEELIFILEDLEQVAELSLKISNKGNKTRKISKPKLKSPVKSSQLAIAPLEEVTLEPGESHDYKVSATARFFGKSEEVFVFCFDGNFDIATKIKIHVGGTQNQMDSNNNMKGRNGAILEKRICTDAFNVWKKPRGDIIPGVPTKRAPNFIDKRLGRFQIPKRMFDILLSPSMSRNEKEEELEKCFSVLSQVLTKRNYRSLFHNLLYLEEMERYLNMRNFDKDRARFKHEGPYLALEIERVLERKPSVIIGDSVRATRPWTEDNSEYQGYIHKIHHNRVLFKFNEQFHKSYNGEDYKLVFEYSKSDFQKNHHALDEMYNTFGVDYCFPTAIKCKEAKMDVTVTKVGDLYHREKDCCYKWFNTLLNKYQKDAIKNIIRGETRPMPYVIFGPPGTGKTITMVECILQIFQLFPNSRIIVGTPSNSAANLIAERLIKSGDLKPGNLIRVVSQNIIEREAVPEFLAPYSGTIDIAADRASSDGMITTESGLKLKMRRSALMMHRIFVGTCVTLGAMMQIKFPRNHFTHVFLDEAGQLLETETIIPISLLNKHTAQVILAGDPRQLGPVVSSNNAKKRGLGLSFMERILEMAPYQRDRSRFEITGYDQRLVTKLRINYRSIPKILSLYSDLFYDGELIKDISETESKEARILELISDILPNADSRSNLEPFYFFGVNGENCQSRDSPSWHNPQEAKTVFHIFRKLLQKRVPTDAIGIISPYQQQVKFIRALLNEIVPDRMPKIGSVEEFQGQERQIIIVTTVRSSSYLIGQDLDCHLGFVRDPKRLNVAISRARACLIIVGNPNLLSNDPYWRKLLEKSIEWKTYSGCPITKTLIGQE